MTTTTPLKRGRKPYTPEQKAVALAASKAQYRNITVDAEIQQLLNDRCDQLEAQFGFKPTISQTLRWLLKKGGN